MKLDELEKICDDERDTWIYPGSNVFIQTAHEYMPKLIAIAQQAKFVFQENMEARGLCKLGTFLDNLENGGAPEEKSA